MKNTLKELLSGILDYAGVYPPAKLDFTSSYTNYCTYRNSPKAFMLGSFVCPITNLEDLRASQTPESPIDVSVIASAAQNQENFFRQLESDVEKTTSYFSHAIPSHNLYSFEVRLMSYDTDIQKCEKVLNKLYSINKNTKLFLEVPFLDGWENSVLEMISRISEQTLCNAKIRTGGLNQNSFPTVKQLQQFIYACANNELPFKATAGLHHPITHWDDEIKVIMHGFFNVFISAICMYHNYEHEIVEKILSSQNTSDFQFYDEYAVICDNKITLEEIQQGRTFALSFGSCSLDEPVEHLVSLGYIEKHYLQNEPINITGGAN